MKAVENDFAKQTHCRLTVAEIKKQVPGTHNKFRSHFLYIITGGKQKSGGNLRHQIEALKNACVFPDYNCKMDLY